MKIEIERVNKASRLQLIDEALATPELTGDRRESVEQFRNELAALAGDEIEHVRFGGSNGDFVGVPPEIRSTVREELERRLAITEALGDLRRTNDYALILHGLLGGTFRMSGGSVTTRVITRAAQRPHRSTASGSVKERRLSGREKREEELRRIDRGLALPRGTPEYKKRLQQARDELSASAIEEIEVVELEGTASELFAVLVPEIRTEVIAGLQERLVDSLERGNETDVETIAAALEWILEGSVPTSTGEGS